MHCNVHTVVTNIADDDARYGYNARTIVILSLLERGRRIKQDGRFLVVKLNAVDLRLEGRWPTYARSQACSTVYQNISLLQTRSRRITSSARLYSRKHSVSLLTQSRDSIATYTASMSVAGLRRRSRWARTGSGSRTVAQQMKCLGLLSCVTGGRRGEWGRQEISCRQEGRHGHFESGKRHFNIPDRKDLKIPNIATF